jgi:hypothetical protein
VSFTSSGIAGNLHVRSPHNADARKEYRTRPRQPVAPHVTADDTKNNETKPADKETHRVLA